MHLLIYNELSASLPIDEVQFYKFCVDEDLQNEATGILKTISQKDYFPNLVCERIELLENSFESVLILCDGRLNWNTAIRLACHIRFHNFSKNTDQLPIVIASENLPDLLFDKNLKGSGDILWFQYEEGFFLKTFNELFTEGINEAGETLMKWKIFFQEELAGKKFPAHSLKILEILSKDYGDRHSIANQWGSVKLALNAGYSKEEIKYDRPPTLYFKYLLKKHESHIFTIDERFSMLKETIKELGSMVSAESLLQDGKLKFSNHPYLRNKKVLLIDDNADKGWEQILKSFFGVQVVSVLSIPDTLKISNYETFDIAFLDLYLPNPNNDNVPDMAYSKKILESLKKDFPHVPIIVFTASNKSWTLDEVLERGADGMYAKESPEYAGDTEYSKENFRSFVKTVIKCLDNYLILRPYWEVISEIKSNYLTEINDLDPDKQFESRINERLEMFFGLLKRGMEQRKYDQERFYFSDYELAFMTLWSLLNEISEAYFDKQRKSFPIKVINDGSDLNRHPDKPGNNTYVLDKFKIWKLISSGETFIDYFARKDDNGKIESNKGFIKLHCMSNFEQVFDSSYNPKEPYFETTDNKIRDNDSYYVEKISMQIAFIIEKLNPISKTTMFKNLINLNKTRNSLYLTHGSDISSGFYEFTEKEKRGDSEKKIRQQHKITPKEDIKDLFELVGFLLTGKIIEVKI